MHPFKLTLKNYRCFPDSMPLSVDIGSGFTAFVGTNNCGKSSLLKFFHEFQSLFSELASNHYGPRPFNVNPRHVEDWQELFFNRNQREMTIEIEDRSALPSHVSKSIVTADRVGGNAVQFVSCISRQEPYDKLTQDFGDQARTEGNNNRLDQE